MEMSNDGTFTFRKNPENIDSGGALTGDVEFRSGDSSVPTLFLKGSNANVGIGIDNPHKATSAAILALVRMVVAIAYLDISWSASIWYAIK